MTFLFNSSLFQYVAIYEYVAADDDEVTIKEGDVIIKAEIVAEGWMVGTNSRTGLTGMLPSNYVEQKWISTFFAHILI